MEHFYDMTKEFTNPDSLNLLQEKADIEDFNTMVTVFNSILKEKQAMWLSIGGKGSKKLQCCRDSIRKMVSTTFPVIYNTFDITRDFNKEICDNDLNYLYSLNFENLFNDHGTADCIIK